MTATSLFRLPLPGRHASETAANANPSAQFALRQVLFRRPRRPPLKSQFATTSRVTRPGRPGLDAWPWPATSEIEEVDDPAARNLTFEIILRFAEYDRGHRTVTSCPA